MVAQWHADLCGLGDMFDPAQVDGALDAMFRHNFKPSMRNFTNPWRLFALNDEAGAIICDYPAGTEKPAIPIPYCEESMHGFEYAFAGLLIARGRIDEGLTVVRAVRSRYNGANRNPWNEIECGSNYARSMASFALLPLFSGFRYDAPRGAMRSTPRSAAAHSAACGALAAARRAHLVGRFGANCPARRHAVRARASPSHLPPGSNPSRTTKLPSPSHFPPKPSIFPPLKSSATP